MSTSFQVKDDNIYVCQFWKTMSSSDIHVYYSAGIGVVATMYGIDVRRISIGDDNRPGGEALLEPVGKWCNLSVGLDYFRAMQVENYATALLAGSAASFIRAQDRRCHLKRSFGDAGLEASYVREAWQCLQREPDRAVSLICGSLGAYDDGDVEATTRRLWHRAARVLRAPKQHKQLYLLAKELGSARSLSGQDVRRLLRRA